MANLALNEVWLATYRCRAADQLGLVTCAYRVTSIFGTGATDLDMATVMDANAGTALIPIIGTGAQYVSTQVRRLRPLPAPVPVTVSLSGGAGTATGDLLPRNVSGLVSKQTAFAGRRFRGRGFIPFPTEDHNDATGHPSAGYLTLLNTVRTFLFGNVLVLGMTNGAQLQATIFHRAGATDDLVTSSSSTAKWAQQHRRGDYGRPN